MVEYVIAALLGAILAGIILLVARLQIQNRELLSNNRTAIYQKIEEIRQDGAQGRQRIESVAGDLRGVRQRLDELMAEKSGTDRQLVSALLAIRGASDTLASTAEKIANLDKKLAATAEPPDIVSGGIVTFPWSIDPNKPFPPFFKQGLGGAKVGLGTDRLKRGDFDWPDIGHGSVIGPDFHIQAQPNFSGNPFSIDVSPDIAGPPDAGSGTGTPAPVTSQQPAPTEGDTASEKRRIVDLMFATTRKYNDGQERFTGERNSTITFGHACIRIPEAHLLGDLERPHTYTLFSLTIYQQREDPQKHFVIRGINILPKERWVEVLGAMPGDDALLFVHGFNTSFEDALYRNAQIVNDLKFKGTAVLFSWPSRGAIADYVYDRDSALGARKPFIEVLDLVAGQSNVKQIHILAHSMGNQVVLDALANYSGATPLKIGELVMAAPDVDRDLYNSIALDVRKRTKGMTLYASAADKALAASKFLAGAIPRAGDVPEDGPIVLENIDSIDATSLGEEIFGLNHSTFATSLSILNDVYLLLSGRRPPRVLEIRAVPEGVLPPKYWQYIGSRS